MTNSRYYRYPSPNPKQPFSLGKDCEQFRYRDEDHFRGFYIAVFTVIDQITFIHMCISAMKSLSDLVNDGEDCSGEPAKAIFISVTQSPQRSTIHDILYHHSGLTHADNHSGSLTG